MPQAMETDRAANNSPARRANGGAAPQDVRSAAQLTDEEILGLDAADAGAVNVATPFRAAPRGGQGSEAVIPKGGEAGLRNPSSDGEERRIPRCVPMKHIGTPLGMTVERRVRRRSGRRMRRLSRRSFPEA